MASDFRVLFRGGEATAANIPLRRALPRASSELPGDSTGPVYAPAALALGARGATRRRDRLPIRSCTRWGLPCHGGHPSCGALLPLRFTLATRASRRRSAACSLLHCPAGHPDRSLTGTSPCGARTFLGDPDKADRRVRAIFSARIHLTSELLRTLSMVAASEPTSWLSTRIHILYHLAWI